jgi:hypothetical protein
VGEPADAVEGVEWRSEMRADHPNWVSSDGIQRRTA